MSYEVHPIGTVQCAQRWHYDAPRQPGLVSNEATIAVLPEYTQALAGLEGFSRIWVVFLFHQAAEKLVIRPPRLAAGSVGAFASRSPHRPNRIGISAVRLCAVRGNLLELSGHDFIDGTPVLDLKPYLSSYDRFDVPVEGWLKEAAPAYQVEFAEGARARLAFLEEQGVAGLRGFLLHQLSFLPDDAERKRVAQVGEQEYVIRYRTWRCRYTVDPEARRCEVTELFSGWRDAELVEGSDDPWQDKALHRLFRARFGV
jgi:tRNA-Thr(GGU) m(6)t(6)A37 methyltransferase TsaA